MNGLDEKKVPAWKRLGLKLARPASNSQSDPSRNDKSNVNPASHEVKSAHRTTSNLAKKRKFVTFAEETKHQDGSRTEQELSSFLASQRGGPEQFTQEEAYMFGQLKNHPGNGPSAAAGPSDSQSTKPKSKKKKKRKAKHTKITSSAEPSQETPSASTAPEEPPGYLVYLRQFRNDRPHWKFQKNKETQVIKHAFNMSLIPASDESAIQAYFRGLQSESARQRLLDHANQVIEETANIPDLEFDHEYGDVEGERLAEEARSQALKQAIFNEKIRLREEDDEAELDTDEFQVKALKRKRALIFQDWAREAFQTGDIQTDRPQFANTIATKQVIGMPNDPSGPINSVFTTVVNEEAEDENGKQIRKRRRVIVRLKKNRTGLVEDDVESVSSVDSDYVKKVEESEDDDSESSEDDDDSDLSEESSDSSDSSESSEGD
jgi:hypothetical protein